MLFALLLLLSPLAGLIHETLVIDDACTPLEDQPVQELSTSWQYSWEQAKNEIGGNAVIPGMEHWTSTDHPINPPDRNERSLLFLKHTLPMGNWQEPTLLIDGRGILLTFRAYVDGKQIHSFGKMNDAGEGNISGISSHLIALDEEHLGKDIVFKIFSDYSNIGIRGRTYIGTRSAIYRFVLQRDITRLVTGILMLLIGIMDFFSYRDNIKTTGPIPMFGILSLALGLYTINVTTLKDLIFFAPVFWFNAYIVAMTVIPVGAIGFIWQTFRPQTGNYLHHLWRLHAGYALACQLFFLMALYQLAPIRVGTLMLNGLRWLLIMEFFMIIAIVGRDAFIEKNVQARIYLGGFVPVILAGIHDSLVGLGKIPSSFSYVPWAMMIFILSLELIRRRKFIRVQNELKRYTVRLEKKSQEKEELLRDLHDGIGGLVTNIKFLSEMGRGSQSLSEMKEALTNISEHASESLNAIFNQRYREAFTTISIVWPPNNFFTASDII